MEQSTPTTTDTTVSISVPFLTGETQAEVVDGELVYDVRDPYALTMHLQARSGRVTWTFARDLLADGVYEPAGDGDVQVWPCLSSGGEAVVVIELSSPSGAAMLETSSRSVQRFLDDVYACLPLGQESAHLSLDLLLAQLLEA
jgi:hypothetical protein